MLFSHGWQTLQRNNDAPFPVRAATTEGPYGEADVYALLERRGLWRAVLRLDGDCRRGRARGPDLQQPGAPAGNADCGGTGAHGCRQRRQAARRLSGDLLEDHVMSPQEFDMGEHMLLGLVMQRHAAVHVMLEMERAVAFEVRMRNLNVGIA